MAALALNDLVVERIGVVDDQPDIRATYGETIIDCGAEPFYEDGPLPPLTALIDRLCQYCDAAVCDFKLTASNYADFDGAELVSELYMRKLPAILCTRYQTRVEEIRKYRRRIPSIISPEQLDVDTIAEGLELCAKEFRGEFSQTRHPYRTLIRFENVEGAHAFFKMPAWQPRTELKIIVVDLPPWLQQTLRREPEYRCHAWSNIGAEHDSDLFFDNWEK